MSKITKKILSILLCVLLVLPFAAMNVTAKEPVGKTVHVGPSGRHTVAQFPKDMITRKEASSNGWRANHQRSFFGADSWIFRNQLSDFQKVMYDELLNTKAGLVNAADYPYEDFVYDENGDVVVDEHGEPMTIVYPYRAVEINLDGYTIGADTPEELIMDILLNDTIASMSAFMEDYPEYFWLWGFDFDLDFEGDVVVDEYGDPILDEFGEEQYENVTLTSLTLLLGFYEDAYETWDDVQTAYDTLLAGIDSVTVEGETRYEKIKSIHDWICTTADYDYTFILPHAYDPLGIFVDPYDFVCEGYSEIFKLLCDREEIPCITVVGYGGGGDDWEGHKWNYVQMENGEWYAMDVTWDDQDTRDNDEDYIMYEYFLSGSETYDVSFGHTMFTESHIAEGALFNFDFYLEYPELSTEMYYYDGNFEVSEDGLWRYQIIDEDEKLISVTSGYYGYPAYLGEDTEIEVPETIDGYTVTEIGTSAFCNFEDVTSITLPETVESIYRFAFEGCSAIETMDLPEGLVSISYGAFTDCASLKEINIPSTLDWIGWYVFYGCESLETVTIPENVTEIGDFSFDTSLAAIYGYTDSYAEWYANEASIRFIPLDESGEPTQELYAGFPDIAGDAWYFDAVRYNAIRGFITGYKSGNFGPADKLQRQDFIVILARISGVDLDSADFDEVTLDMPDVAKGSYYETAVKWAVENQIIKGYDNGSFGVGDPITREQVATILYRYMGEPAVSSPTATLKPFSDKDTISKFAKNAMVWAIQNGIISGKDATTLAPTATAARAEIATIVMRMNQQGMFGYPYAENPTD